MDKFSIRPTLGKTYIEYWTHTANPGYDNQNTYFVMFSKNKRVSEWIEWARGIQETQRDWKQSNVGVVLMNTEKISGFPEWYISCWSCHPNKFTFHPASENSLTESFRKIARTVHPDKVFALWDLFGELERHVVKKTLPPTFTTITPTSNPDIMSFSIIYPNQSYIVDSLSMSLEFMAPRRTTIQLYLPVTSTNSIRLTSISVRFLTCDGLATEESNGLQSFNHFLSSYQSEIWICLIIAILVIAVVIKVTIYMGRSENGSNNQAPILLPIAFLFEQSIPIGPTLRKYFAAKCILAPWLLMCIILSNAYKGSNVTDLTAPLKPPLVTKFEQILARHYTIFVPQVRIYFPRVKKYMEYPKPRSRFLSDVQNAQSGYSGYSSSFLDNLHDSISIVMERHNITLLQAILNCNKTALAAYGSDVDNYESQLKVLLPQAKHIVKSEEHLFSVELGWGVQYGFDPRLEMRIRALYESGLVNVSTSFLKFVKMMKFRGRNRNVYHGGEDAKVKSLGIEGNFSVVFYLYLFLIGLCCGFHLMERGCKKSVKM